MSAALSEKAFQRLKTDLAAILEAAQRASTAEKVAGYWSLGERLVAERLSEEAGYHNSILREVALDLGITPRLLQQAVLLYRAYSAPPEGPLSWAHYRLIAPLRTKKERSFYEKRAQSHVWTVRDLQAAIRADLYAGGEVQELTLKRPTSTGYLYRADNPRLVDGDTLDLDIDLGFQTWSRRRIRLASINTPEPGSAKGRAATSAVLRHLARAEVLVIKTEKVDLHGRYVGDIFLSPHTTTIDDCYRHGKYLNALLVAEGHATVIR